MNKEILKFAGVIILLLAIAGNVYLNKQNGFYLDNVMIGKIAKADGECCPSPVMHPNTYMYTTQYCQYCIPLSGYWCNLSLQCCLNQEPYCPF